MERDDFLDAIIVDLFLNVDRPERHPEQQLRELQTF